MPDRPNFLLLIGEDNGRHLGCYGDPMNVTPTLDALAADGCRYTNGFGHAPVCAPSRSALVTGMHPYSLGVHQMRSTLLDPPRLFTHELVDAGYDVQWPTKTDFNLEPTAGWRSGDTNWWDPDGSGLPTDRPFFAYRNADITHESRMWNDPPSWDGDPVFRRPASRVDPDDVPVPPYLPDLPEVRQHIARYYENLAAQDLAWAECLDALDRSGQADNTVVVYLSDHGRGLPREKRWCYDAGIHLPLIVRGPGIDRGVSDRLVSWVDIAPTVLRLAGVDVPIHYQGQDFLTGPPRQYHFAGRDRMDEAYDCQRAVRSDRWHYVRNAFPEISGARRNMYMETSDAVQAIRNTWAEGKLSGSANVWFEPRGHEQLFDVHADPDCVNDVAGAHPDIVTKLAGALDAHLAKVGDWGAVSETVMVEAGDVADRIEENTQRLAPLPTHQQPEPPTDSILIPTDRPDAATVIPPARQALDAARAHANR